MGAESVSGYMRSAPGSTRSKMVVPSGSAFRVSCGTPSKAIRARSSMVSKAVFTSSSAAQKMICASLSPAFNAWAAFSNTLRLTTSSKSSLVAMFGRSRQAITLSRSANSQ